MLESWPGPGLKAAPPAAGENWLEPNPPGEAMPGDMSGVEGPSGCP